MDKITALERTIYNLENDVYKYNWADTESCNCGILARTILGGKTAIQTGLFDSPSIDKELGCFTQYTHCLTTNLPLPEVFLALKNAGFSQKELIELEHLSNKNIIQRGGVQMYMTTSTMISVETNTYRSNKQEVIKYLKAWVAILKEEQEQNKPQEAQEGKTPIKEVIKYIKKEVDVPESLSKQTKELVLS